MSVAKSGTPEMKDFVPPTGADDPDELGIFALAAELLADDAVLGVALCQDLANALFAHYVGDGDRRGVGLTLDLDVGSVGEDL